MMSSGDAIEVLPQIAELFVPCVPLLGGSVEVVFHMAEKLHLHDVDLLHRNTRNLGPCFICVGVVVQN